MWKLQRGGNFLPILTLLCLSALWPGNVNVFYCSIMTNNKKLQKDEAKSLSKAYQGPFLSDFVPVTLPHGTMGESWKHWKRERISNNPMHSAQSNFQWCSNCTIRRFSNWRLLLLDSAYLSSLFSDCWPWIIPGLAQQSLQMNQWLDR